MDAAQPRQIGNYTIVSKLGEGGMGVVWKARDPRLNRFVALKVLPAARARDAERRARFLQEAQAASALNHPNIVTIYDIGQQDGADFIAMEYIEGHTLEALIGRNGLKVADVLRYGAQIADALAAAHKAGIVHRDLKPLNIMVTPAGLVKVLDFGLAKLVDEEPLSPDASTRTARVHTEQGAVMGTVAYMSPEQAEGRTVDRRSDVFSFGSILYEMVTGRQPFSGQSRVSVLSAIVNAEPASIETAIPAELSRLIRRCLRKDPDSRYQHMDDLRISLLDLKEESDSGRLALPGAVAAQGRSRLWWTGAGLLLAIAVVAVAWIISRPRNAASTAAPVLRQLTFDSGLTTDPTYWPGGNMLAYASDRASGTNLDIWVQQMGGETRRLTQHEADDHQPDFSPDGTRIVFRSERDGGGIWVVPTLGGPERRLTRTGYRPRFSPDGKWLVYWVGDNSGQFGIGNSYVIPAGGGEPRRIGAKLGGALHPFWSADGRYVLYRAGPETMNLNTPTAIWAEPSDGGEAIRTDLATKIPYLRGNFPVTWYGEQILYSRTVGDAVNLFALEVDPKTFRARSVERQLTSGAGLQAQPVAGGGKLIYANVLQNDDIWAVTLDGTGRGQGTPLRLTQDLASDASCTISADGKRLAYFSVRSQDTQLIGKELANGKLTVLATMPSIRPLAGDISPDGQRVSFTRGVNEQAETFVVPFEGGTEQKVCAACVARDWAGNSGKLLISRRKPGDVMVLLDPETRAERAVANMLAPARGAPDGKWWAAYSPVVVPDAPGVYAVPILADRVAEREDVVPITNNETRDYLVSFSPDQSTIYFLSPRDGFHCLWAQPLDASTMKRTGEPFAVSHFHSARTSTVYVGGGFRRLSAARDKVVFTMAERTGNLWMTELPETPH